MFDLKNAEKSTKENAALFYEEAAIRAEAIENKLATIWDKFRGDESILSLLDEIQDRMDKVRVGIVCGQNSLKNSADEHLLDRQVAGFLGQADNLEADLHCLHLPE